MLGQTDRFLFFVGVIAAATASILMIAPSAHHRFAWPVATDEMERLLAIGTTEARGGLLALGVAITASVYVVADVIFGGLVPVVTAGVLGTGLGALWVVLPLSMKGSRTGRPKR
jgi:hypothetical protein